MIRNLFVFLATIFLTNSSCGPEGKGLQREVTPEQELTLLYLERINAFTQELSADEQAQVALIEAKDAIFEAVQTNPFQQQYTGKQKLSTLMKDFKNDPQAFELLIEIKDLLYGPEGKLLKYILLEAAYDAYERESLFNAIEYTECRKRYYWWQCNPGIGLTLEKLQGSKKMDFDGSRLHRLISELNMRLRQDGAMIDKNPLIWSIIKLIPILDYRSLDWFHALVQSITKEDLEIWFNQILPYLEQNRTTPVFLSKLLEEHQSWGLEALRSLKQARLKEILTTLSDFLLNPEYGLIWRMRKTKG